MNREDHLTAASGLAQAIRVFSHGLEENGEGLFEIVSALEDHLMALHANVREAASSPPDARASCREAHTASMPADDKVQLSRLRDLEGPINAAHGAALVLETIFQDDFCQGDLKPDQLCLAGADGWKTFAVTDNQFEALNHMVYDNTDRIRKIYRAFHAAYEEKDTADPPRTGVGSPRKAMKP